MSKSDPLPSGTKTYPSLPSVTVPKIRKNRYRVKLEVVVIIFDLIGRNVDVQSVVVECIFNGDEEVGLGRRFGNIIDFFVFLFDLFEGPAYGAENLADELGLTGLCNALHYVKILALYEGVFTGNGLLLFLVYLIINIEEIEGLELIFCAGVNRSQILLYVSTVKTSGSR